MYEHIDAGPIVSLPIRTRISRNGLAAIRRFEEAKAGIKHLNEVKDHAEQVLRAELGDAEIGMHAGIVVVKVMHSTNSSVNQKLLKEEFPEAAAATITVKPYTFLKGLL